jgi:hypothetical protein
MATNDPTPAAAGDDAPAAAATPAPAAPRRRIPGRALAITGIAVGSVLTLGLTFAGGVALGQVLPGGPGDRGPISAEAGAVPVGPMGDRGERIGDRIGERVEQRMDERMEQRDELRDERRAQFEQWLQEQGIDPSEIPAPPAPPAP